MYKFLTKRYFCILLTCLGVYSALPQTPPENYTREWGTYFGSDDLDWGIIDVKVDNNGNSWVAGMVNTEAATTAFDELVTSDAYQETGAGGRDIFIVKFSPDGDLVYATYFGGEEEEVLYGLDVKGSNVYIAGITTSETGIATSGSYQEDLLQNTDPNGNPYDFPRAAFIAQFDTLGVLQWSTYYQGDRVMSSSSWGDVKAGNDEDVYLWTQSSSSNLGTSGALKEDIPPPYNNSGEYIAPHYPVLTRFDDDGQLLWSTYYGPDITSSNDSKGIPQGGIAVDSQNNVYVSGTTDDNTYYGTIGAHQSTNGGQNDIFFSKFSSTGQRIWSTYYGGTGSEGVPKIHISLYDSFFITGMTTSSNAIATPGTYQDNISGSSGNFVVKFGLNGQRLWGTYYNEDSLVFTAIDEDQYGNVFVCNVTGYLNTVTDDLATEGAWQETPEGGIDNFILKLNPLGTNLEWGTYYGGDEKELNGKSLIVTDNDEIIMLGSSRSDYNIASEDAFQTSLIGTENLFLTKFIPCPEPEEPIATATQEFQPNQGKTLTGLEVEIPEWSGSEPIITWYADEDGEEEIPKTTELEDGETYYVSRRIQGCGESDLVAITAEACQQPEPPTGTSPQGFDNGDTLADLDIEGENLTWYIDEEMTEEIPETTELEDGVTYYVSQTVADCESELISISVDEDLLVSAENFQQVKLFPNPNNGNFQLTGLPAEAIELTIYDIHGKVLYTESLNKTRTSQSIVLNDQLSVGVYFVSLHSKQQHQNFKMVVE